MCRLRSLVVRLFRPPSRLPLSSVRVVLRLWSLCAVTVTIAGSIVAVLLVLAARLGRLDDAERGAAIRLLLEFEEGGRRLSEPGRGNPLAEEISEIGVGWVEVGDAGRIVSRWLREVRAVRGAGPSSSLAGDFGVAVEALTASRKRLYRPLRPCWTSSPATLPFASVDGEVRGGRVKSLNVVSASDWLADVWILSSVLASCSLSTTELVESEFTESRRRRKLTGDGKFVDTGDSVTGRDVVLLGMMQGRRRVPVWTVCSVLEACMKCPASSCRSLYCSVLFPFVCLFEVLHSGVSSSSDDFYNEAVPGRC